MTEVFDDLKPQINSQKAKKRAFSEQYDKNGDFAKIHKHAPENALDENQV
jgi:hypothetical protein